MNQVQVASLINNLAGIKARQAMLAADAEVLVTQLKKEGGGESALWRAELVKIRAHLVKIKAHKQLRLYAK